MTRGHKHTWKRAPEWDRSELLREGLLAVECVPCRSVRWIDPAAPQRATEPVQRPGR